MIERKRMGELVVLEIQHAKEVNPFSRAMTRQLIRRAVEEEANDEVEGVLIWGGGGAASP